MMHGDGRMDVVLLPRDEEIYNREEILGRDAKSVFPSLSKSEPGKDAIKEAMERKFVTETQLEELKAKHGLRPDDGTFTVEKPLAQLLADRKAAKEEEFQAQWRQMKIGKNRPLEADELDFINGLRESDREKERQRLEQEQRELEEFKQLMKIAAAPEATLGEIAAAEFGPSLPSTMTTSPAAGRLSTAPAARPQPKPAAAGAVVGGNQRAVGTAGLPAFFKVAKKPTPKAAAVQPRLSPAPSGGKAAVERRREEGRQETEAEDSPAAKRRKLGTGSIEFTVSDFGSRAEERLAGEGRSEAGEEAEAAEERGEKGAAEGGKHAGDAIIGGSREEGRPDDGNTIRSGSGKGSGRRSDEPGDDEGLGGGLGGLLGMYGSDDDDE